MKKNIILVVAFILLFYGCYKQEVPDIEGKFHYSVYIQQPDKTSFPVTDFEMDKGNLEQNPMIHFLPVYNAYLYLILFSPDEKVRLLFPYSTRAFPGEYIMNTYFLPDENREEYLKFPGEYHLHVLVSASRYKNIEKLFYQYNTNRRTGDPGVRNPEIYTRIYAEIQNIRKKYRWVQNFKNRPFYQAGVVRSEDNLPGIQEVTFKGIFIQSYSFIYR